MMISKMTNEEIKNRINELYKILDFGPCDKRWDAAYSEYAELTAEQDKRYREENQEAFNKFYNENIKGKTWNEIDPDIWGWYSDWHKDMYGYRPKRI